MEDHNDVLARVVALVDHARMLRAEAGESGTPVTSEGLAIIVRGALTALEYGDVSVAKLLLAGYLAMSAEAIGVNLSNQRLN
jgi:hypothetical protein